MITEKNDAAILITEKNDANGRNKMHRIDERLRQKSNNSENESGQFQEIMGFAVSRGPPAQMIMEASVFAEHDISDLRE